MSIGEKATTTHTEHVAPKHATRSHPVHPDTVLELTLVLRRKTPLPDPHDTFGSLLPRQRKHLTHESLAAHHGARASDIISVRAFAHKHSLVITEKSAESRVIALTGQVSKIEKAFGVAIHHYEDERGTYQAATESPSIPAELAGIVEAVLGLHRRPVFGRHRTLPQLKRDCRRALSELAKAYGFPTGTDGSGETIGLIELGGGFYPSDIAAYSASIGFEPQKIKVVEVHGTRNTPADVRHISEFLEAVAGERKWTAAMEQAQCTIEVTMDLEILAALAPGANIVVYFAPGDEQGIYNALTTAIHDTHNRPGVLSISWGEPEISISDRYIALVEDALIEAAHLGITVCASSGDDGAYNNSPDSLPTVNFPASSPHCLACGGTTAQFEGATITSEIVWNSKFHGNHGITGGGVSRKFPVPHWQSNSRVPLGPTGKHGRGVPDVAGAADPHCGCEVLVTGHSVPSCGTSAVAPLWAALVARMNEALGTRCGHLHSLLYEIAAHDHSAFRSIVEGHNEVYQASHGWDACTGHGTPRGERLLHHLTHGLPKR